MSYSVTLICINLFEICIIWIFLDSKKDGGGGGGNNNLNLLFLFKRII